MTAGQWTSERESRAPPIRLDLAKHILHIDDVAVRGAHRGVRSTGRRVSEPPPGERTQGRTWRRVARRRHSYVTRECDLSDRTGRARHGGP